MKWEYIDINQVVPNSNNPRYIKDEDIGFNEFQYRYKCLEMAREDLNNIYDYIIMVLIRRDGLDDIYVE